MNSRSSKRRIPRTYAIVREPGMLAEAVKLIREGSYARAEELLDMAKDETTEVGCQFCDKKYYFTSSELRKLSKKSG